MSNTYQVVDRCDFQPGQTVNNQYTVRKVLGEGSFGMVYLVEDRQRRPHALKLLRLWEVPAEIRQPLMDRFELEFRTGQIHCDYLVQSMDYGKVGGNPYIVMEYCPGGDLQPLLGKGDARNVQICRDILEGLGALHVNGKVHRDLKPENVLFKQSGVAALTDFGIAGDRTHRMTQRNIFGKPNQIFGTYAYMPPEQVSRMRGGATVLPTTDIFSFGVLAYQLLTGALPFGILETHNDLAEYQIRAKNGTWSRERLATLPDGQRWTRIIEGCLSPDFRQRLQTVDDVLRLLPRQASACGQQPAPGTWQPAAGYHPAAAYQPAPQRQPPGIYLRVLLGEEYGRVYNLSAMFRKGTRLFTIGRQTDNTIAIKSDYSDVLSRHHCTLEAGNGQWLLRDGQWQREGNRWQESRNGTFVNSRPVGQRGYYLAPGDIIAIGDVTLRFDFF